MLLLERYGSGTTSGFRATMQNWVFKNGVKQSVGYCSEIEKYLKPTLNCLILEFLIQAYSCRDRC